MNWTPGRPLTAIGKQSLTVSSTAVGFTASNYSKNFGPMADTGTARANYAFCTVEDQPVRWSVVGTAPDANTGGHEYVTGTSFWLTCDADIINFLAIRTGGTDGVIHATFYC